LNIDSQNGNRLLEASDRTINGKKAKTMLRQYDKDGKTMKLLQVYFEHNNMIYLANYEAEPAAFDKNSNSANDVIESIKFK
ncbi:MAG: hypothetical protein Q8O89_02250, partial [Nanoarchaeota archaeon]|nr:hypothetical protein [Nanoarchaeota archaeon]